MDRMAFKPSQASVSRVRVNTTSKRRKTQIIYNEWNIPPQAGQARRLADGFEFSMRRRGYVMYPFGPRTPKTIMDSQISAITHWPGRHGPGWIIIAFDNNDEIMLSDSVRLDLDQSLVRYPVLAGFDDRSSGAIRSDMVERQRALGPVSWENGRSSLDGTTSQGARRWKLISLAAIATAIASLLLLRI
jgi:hypothetical protein